MLIFVLVVAIVYTIRRNKAIIEIGIETKVVVSRIEEDVGGDDQTVEARINDPPAHTHVGDPIRIKYLPEKEK